MRVVLVSPSLPENVGMVARAMRAFGFGDLVLVGGVDPLHPQAMAAASGASAILEAARTVATLRESLAGITCAVGTTARPYARPDLGPQLVEQAAKLAVRNTPMAWVMGTERSGLTRNALTSCQLVARIPSCGPSLNLAQAVAICLYETAKAQASLTEDTAALAAVSHAVPDREIGQALGAWLVAIGAARPQDAASKTHTLTGVLARLDLNLHEAALLKAIAQRVLRTCPTL